MRLPIFITLDHFTVEGLDGTVTINVYDIKRMYTSENHGVNYTVVETTEEPSIYSNLSQKEIVEKIEASIRGAKEYMPC